MKRIYILITLIVVILFLGGGSFFIYTEFFQNPDTTNNTITKSERKPLPAKFGTSRDNLQTFEGQAYSEKVKEHLETLFSPVVITPIQSIVAETDGPLETEAYVEPADSTGNNWIFGYDPVDIFNENGEFKNKKQFTETVIHEVAHIITLKNPQVEHVPIEQEYVECEIDQHLLDEGCATNTSYITKFVKEFWSNNDIDDAQDNIDNPDFAFDNYDKRPDSFVSDYAATNEVEDIAESFLAFVVTDKPAGNTVAEKKILFFYDYPELLQIRERAREQL